MDMLAFALLFGFIFYLGFAAGQQFKSSPGEEEMIRRIKQIRYERALAAKIDADIEKDAS